MSYVDALFDLTDIQIVERKDGKRHFRVSTKYTFYYEDPEESTKVFMAIPLTRIVCKNTKDFPKKLLTTKIKIYSKVMLHPILPMFE